MSYIFGMPNEIFEVEIYNLTYLLEMMDCYLPEEIFRNLKRLSDLHNPQPSINLFLTPLD
ncbi:hypothetical protein YC2023_090928 [Brassica napus]